MFCVATIRNEFDCDHNYPLSASCIEPSFFVELSADSWGAIYMMNAFFSVKL